MNVVLIVVDSCPRCGHDRYSWGDSPVYAGRPPWCPYDDEDDHQWSSLRRFTRRILHRAWWGPDWTKCR